MNASALYIGAPVQIETSTGWEKKTIYSLSQFTCMVDNITEMALCDIHPVPLTSRFLSDAEYALYDQGFYTIYSELGKNWVIRDTESNAIVTTVKYEHELIKLFELLTGCDLFEEVGE
jgi:hypothetical protein